jgi:hypothetical protein
MCPLYDKETGEIEGWIADAPNDPNGAAVTYIAVAEAIADREEHVSPLPFLALIPSPRDCCMCERL